MTGASSRGSQTTAHGHTDVKALATVRQPTPYLRWNARPGRLAGESWRIAAYNSNFAFTGITGP
jgi:hypothetical protein